MTLKLIKTKTLATEYRTDPKTLVKRLTEAGVKPHRVIHTDQRTFKEWDHTKACYALDSLARHVALVEARRLEAEADATAAAAKAKAEREAKAVPTPPHIEASSVKAIADAQSSIGAAILEKLTRMQTQLNTIEHAVSLLASELGGITSSMEVEQ